MNAGTPEIRILHPAIVSAGVLNCQSLYRLVKHNKLLYTPVHKPFIDFVLQLMALHELQLQLIRHVDVPASAV